MEQRLLLELEGLVERVTTLSPNHLADWWEIQEELDRIADLGLDVSVDEVADYLRDAGVEQPDMQELRHRLRQTFARGKDRR